MRSTFCMPTLLALGLTGAVFSKPLRRDYEPIQQSIVEELRQVPLDGPFANGDAMAMPNWSDEHLARYRADYNSFAELRTLLGKEPDKHPVRAATLRALDILREDAKLIFMDRLKPPPKFAKQDKQKAAVLAAQKRVGLAVFELDQCLGELEAAGEKRMLEKSPRWRAHYDFLRLACLARLVTLSEYNYALGHIRADRLPALPEGAKGWRLVSSEKIGIPETSVKNWMRDLKRLAEEIQQTHPKTPWAFLAERRLASPRGLVWRIDQ